MVFLLDDNIESIDSLLVNPPSLWIQDIKGSRVPTFDVRIKIFIFFIFFIIFIFHYAHDFIG
jgi:hypothetical protein